MIEVLVRSRVHAHIVECGIEEILAVASIWHAVIHNLLENHVEGCFAVK